MPYREFDCLARAGMDADHVEALDPEFVERVERRLGVLGDLQLAGEGVRVTEADAIRHDNVAVGGENRRNRVEHLPRQRTHVQKREGRPAGPERLHVHVPVPRLDEMSTHVDISYTCAMLGATASTDARLLVGYGRSLPVVEWPDAARLAVCFVVNYEEGSEYAFSEDGRSETYGLRYPFPADQHNMRIESEFEHGSRVGIWRLFDLFARYEIPLTIHASAVALEQPRRRRGDRDTRP